MNIRKTLTVIYAICFMLFISYTFDYTFFQQRFFCHIFVESACDYTVPDNFKIVSNGKLYAVKRLDGFSSKENPIYLYQKFAGDMDDIYVSIRKPTLFFNECKTKGFLKSYLRQQEPKIKGFE